LCCKRLYSEAFQAPKARGGVLPGHGGPGKLPVFYFTNSRLRPGLLICETLRHRPGAYFQARLSTVFSKVAPGTVMFHFTVQL
jgi:hypothetical protein